MAHVIIKEGLADREWFETWTNTTLAELWDHLETYTPEWAEKISTVPARDLAPIAREFAAAAPRATTMCNRGSSAHVNGYWNDRAIVLLNALVGSVGQPGGWCWMYTGGCDSRVAKPPPCAPSPQVRSLLADPPEFVLANRWNTMRVGEIVYWYLEQGRARIQVYMSYNLDSPLTWPEMDVTRNVFLDESKIGFHVAINPFFSETASFADIVLPESDPLTLDALAADYFDHFVNPRDRAPLIQSLHEGGAYEGDAARAVREIASAAGVEFDAEAARAVPPDHLGCELLLWDVLAARDPEAAAEFARRHLAWAVAPLRRNAEGTGFYSSLRAALAAFVTELT